MVTSINLGGFTQQNGKTVLNGSVSNLDTEGLIKALADAKRLPAVTLEDRITTNSKITTAFTQLKDIFGRFQTAANFLRNPPGVGNANANAFQYRSATVTTPLGTDGSSIVSATVEAGARVQNININEVTQLATAKKQESSEFLLASADSVVVSSTASAGQMGAGTVSLRRIGGGTIDVAFTAGDTLNGVAAKFNSVSGQTGIQATVLKVSENGATDSFKLIFSATQTGETYDFDLDNSDVSGTIADPSGVFSTTSFANKQAAQNAIFEIDGTPIERETNTIDDAIQGVAFTLRQQSAIGVNVSVGADNESVKNAILNFVDSYNEFRIFAAKQTATDENGVPLEDAALGGNNTLRSMLAQMSSEMSRVVGGIADGGFSRLADVGISFSDFAGDDETPTVKNILTVDESKLQTALESNFSGVKNLFEFSITSDNENLSVFSRTNDLAVSKFTITYDPLATNKFTATYKNAQNVDVVVNLNATAISGGGFNITGPDNSPFKGLKLIYASNDAATMNVNISQGFGDRLYNSLSNYVSNDGQVTNEINSITEQNNRYQTQIDRIDTIVESYREQLLKKFSALEAALSQSNTILQSLAAQADARNNA